MSRKLLDVAAAKIGRLVASVYARRTVASILGTDVAGWTMYPTNRGNAVAFLAWFREWGPEV